MPIFPPVTFEIVEVPPLDMLPDEKTGAFRRHRTPSPADSAVGTLTGSDTSRATAGVAPSAIDNFLHGTTGATNAVLEGTGAGVRPIGAPA